MAERQFDVMLKISYQVVIQVFANNPEEAEDCLIEDYRDAVINSHTDADAMLGGDLYDDTLEIESLSSGLT